MHSIHLSQVSFAFSGAKPIFENIGFAISSGITALAGPNGCGKTTLMRLMMRALAPQQGRIAWQGFSDFGWLPQSLGSASQSSGEEKICQLSVLLRGRGALFLDEPETHLDTGNRQWLRSELARYRGLIVIASHDAALLNGAETILHIENGSVTPYRMPYAAYRQELENRKARDAAKTNHAIHELEKNERARRVHLERQLRRSRNAAAKAPLAGIPRIARGIMKRNAEVTLGKIVRQNSRQNTADHAALAQLREQQGLQLQYRFAATAPATRAKIFLEIENLQLYDKDGQPLWQTPVSFTVKPGERLQIHGANGGGKSMLLKTICGSAEMPYSGNIRRGRGAIRLIDSNHSGVDADASVLALARDAGIGADTGETRRLLGAYGFRGDAVFRAFSTLSAGEKMRLRLFLITRSAQPCDYLFADEAETGLDHAARALFAEYLRGFPGAVLFVSHDEAFAVQVQASTALCLT